MSNRFIRAAKWTAGFGIALAGFAASVVSVLQYIDGRTQRDAVPSAPTVQSSQDSIPKPITLSTAPPSETRSLVGEWRLTTQIDTSTVPRYKGLSLGYHIVLHPISQGYHGARTKSSEGNQRLTGSAQIAMTDLQASTSGDRLVLSWREIGHRRTSVGRARFRITHRDTLFGTFNHDAANATGQALLILQN